MIQDITAIYHNEYIEQSPNAGDYIMFVKGRNVLIKKNTEEIEFLRYEELDEVEMAFRYLFALDTEEGRKRFFLGEADLLMEDMLKEYSYEQQNVFRTKQPKELAFAGITACQLANWYETTRFCGTCGNGLEHDKKERMMRCPSCNALHYPKISPAVIVAVTNGDKLLMTKYAGRDYKNYALVAGFAEIGETVEETVKREVMEEAGLKVKNIRYYKSQPWSFTDTLLLGFWCEVDGNDNITMDEEELSVAEWITRDEIPTEYDGISLTNEMMMRFKNGEA
ncbi:MAG: NAD(+) diphosphatase [Lachnospiraceae bacterium]|nr:NAD(+) diphosphatase [Lachnospiraceae bacterium]MBQ6995675.1 NAD(+) diphosphatase [Lachnospiraceae bacterium]